MTRIAHILLTRPAEASARFASMLHARVPNDVQIVISPLIGIQHMPIAPSDVQGKTPVFTSLNSVAAWRASALPARGAAFCVGDATMQAAKQVGFDAISAKGDVSDLQALLIQNPSHAPFVHICGQHTRGDLAETLRSLGIDAQSVQAYDQPLLPLSDEAKHLLNGQNRVIVPLFSPRTAAQFAAECLDPNHALCVAMSPAIADHVPGAKIAETPDAQSMITAILDLL